MVTIPVNVEAVFSALEDWIKQRPGLDPANYGLHPEQLRYSSPAQRNDARRNYRAEIRSIGNDRKRALKALDEARGLTPAQPDLLMDAFSAFSGRLQWIPAHPYELRESDPPEAGLFVGTEVPGRLEYTTGQYWPTEFRKAAASVLERYVSLWKQRDAEQHPQTFTYRTMEDVESANRAIGNHWFDADTMRFFKTKIESGLVAGHRFITSEKGPDGVRKYTVREACPDGTIDTVGEFQQYKTRDAARAALLKNPEDE